MDNPHRDIAIYNVESASRMPHHFQSESSRLINGRFSVFLLLFCHGFFLRFFLQEHGVEGFELDSEPLKEMKEKENQRH